MSKKVDRKVSEYMRGLQAASARARFGKMSAEERRAWARALAAKRKKKAVSVV